MKPFIIKPKINSFVQKPSVSFFSKPVQLNKQRFHVSAQKINDVSNDLIKECLDHIDRGDAKSLKAVLVHLPQNFNTVPFLVRAEEKQQFEIIKILLKLRQHPIAVNEKITTESEKQLQSLIDRDPDKSLGMSGR